MPADVWDDSAAYEAYVGRWSRLVAADFVRWLGPSPQQAWLDFGCGTGALTRAILATADPRLVVGCDRSSGYIAGAKAQAVDERAQYVTADIATLPRANGGFDFVVSGLVLNFLPAPLEALAAMAARLRHDGVVAAYVWDYADGMQMMRIFWDSACSLNPAARDLDEGTRFPLCRPAVLRQLFEEAGCQGVEVHPLDITTPFRNFDDYWSPFLGGQGPAPGYVLSLPPDRRNRLRDFIRSRLPVGSDGTITLTARAWAVRGTAT